MALTNPTAVPAGKKATVKAICETHGPNLLGDAYPQVDGVPKDTLTQAEVAEVFEHITRKFWRDLIAAHEADAAATTARDTALAANAGDPFA